MSEQGKRALELLSGVPEPIYRYKWTQDVCAFLRALAAQDQEPVAYIHKNGALMRADIYDSWSKEYPEQDGDLRPLYAQPQQATPAAGKDMGESGMESSPDNGSNSARKSEDAPSTPQVARHQEQDAAQPIRDAFEFYYSKKFGLTRPLIRSKENQDGYLSDDTDFAWIIWRDCCESYRTGYRKPSGDERAAQPAGDERAKFMEHCLTHYGVGRGGMTPDYWIERLPDAWASWQARAVLAQRGQGGER